MTTFAFILIATAIAALLVNYARHDRFAGAATRADDHDDLGPLELPQHLDPRH
jgi:hypothetical protein